MSDDSSKRGIIMREAHLPGAATIDAYGNGGFRFAEMSHVGSLLCLPSGVYGWQVEAATEISAETLDRVWQETGDLEVLFLGMGKEFGILSAELKEKFRESDIIAEPMSTGAAIRTYNVLLGEGRAVGCALIAVG